MTTQTTEFGTIEISIPRIAGVRSEHVAVIQANGRDCDYMVTKAIRHNDGELQVLPSEACRSYVSKPRAVRAAQKWLAIVEAR